MAKKSPPKTVRLATLQPIPYNPRAITEEAESALAQSLARGKRTLEDGSRTLLKSVVLNRQGLRIVSGHQRIKQLIEQGQQTLSEKDIRWIDVEPESVMETYFLIAHNSPTIKGNFDPDGLIELVNDIVNMDAELGEALQLPSMVLTTPAKKRQPSEAEEPAKPTMTRSDSSEIEPGAKTFILTYPANTAAWVRQQLKTLDPRPAAAIIRALS